MCVVRDSLEFRLEQIKENVWLMKYEKRRVHGQIEQSNRDEWKRKIKRLLSSDTDVFIFLFFGEFFTNTNDVERR